jgi:hypothetical protein
MLSPLWGLLHLDRQSLTMRFVPATLHIFNARRVPRARVPWNGRNGLHVIPANWCEEVAMKKTLAILATIGVVGAAAVTAPAPAEARGIGPGLGFGLAAGALIAGAAAANAYPYYGPSYGYYGYGPRYYSPGYAYYGGPVYYPRRHYYRHYRRW